MRHFRHMMEGTAFHLKTNHKPTIAALQRATDRDIPRGTRHLNYISIFTTDIGHISDEDNSVAYPLSRKEKNQLEKKSDEDDLTYCFSILCNSKTEKFKKTGKHLHRWNKQQHNPVESTWCPLPHPSSIARPFIPNRKRKEFFQRVHDLSHPWVRTPQTSSLSARYGRTWAEISETEQRSVYHAKERKSHDIIGHQSSPYQQQVKS